MRLLRIGDPGRERPAVLDDDGVARDLSGLIGDIGPGFFARGGLAELAASLADPAVRAALPAVDGRIGAPVARPGKVVCIGLNYRDHAEETGAAIPERPGRPDQHRHPGRGRARPVRPPLPARG
jgi:2-keto-4-pentenoate hydratase/2-oxohepta-3-ene-1,7-dioic acid hydratase in catechol pathway